MKITSKMPSDFVSNDYDSISFLDKLANSVVKLLLNRKLKISVAESLTGGMIAQYITSISGASEIFELGIVSYTNRIKTQELNVSQGILDKYTAVSEQTAIAMAQGVMKKTGSDISVAVTGLAGPGGGTKILPVGTVYACVIYKDNVNVVNLKLYEKYENLDREKIRKLTTAYAFKMVEDIL